MASEKPEEFMNKLVVLPGVPAELAAINSSTNFILGTGKTIQSLYYMGMRGVVVWKRVEWPSNCPSSSAVKESDKPSHGCIFIPAPHLDRVVIVKNVHDISTEERVENIFDSIKDQLQCLNEIVSKLKTTVEDPPRREKKPAFLCFPSNEKKNASRVKPPDNLEVHLFISSSSNKAKIAALPNLKNKLSNFLSDETIFPAFEVKTVFTFEANFEKEISKRLNKTFHNTDIIKNDIIKKMISLYEGELQQEQFYHFSCASNPSQPTSSESNHVDEMIEQLENFFPNRRDQLLTIPHINQLQDNMLYTYTDQGELGEFCTYTSYLGEVRRFSEEILAALKKHPGFFIKGFSNVHLNTIVNKEHLIPQQFEFDWLYIGADKIIIFEVGMTKNPEKPKTTIRNKIKQVLTKSIPQMQLVLYSVLQSKQLINDKKNQCSYAALVEKLLKIVVFIPGLTHKSFVSEISDIKKTCEKITDGCQPSKKQLENDNVSKIILKDKFYLNLFVGFLVEMSGKLKIVHVNEAFEVIDDGQFVDENLITQSPEDHLLKYFSSLISTAMLNVIDMQDGMIDRNQVLDVDERFISSMKKWLEGLRKCGKKTDVDKIVLSPQQHRILSERRNHLMITGMPGSGKTALLLCMCELLSKENNVEKIFLVFDEKKTLFQNYVAKIQEKTFSQTIKNKTSLCGIDSSNLHDFLTKHPKVNNLHN